MTSMPASRRARAMIFAPRSCPSRPGLATTTRILRCDCVLTAAAILLAPPPRGRPRRSADLDLQAHLRRVERAHEQVRAALPEPLGVRPRRLQRRAELARALGDDHIVRARADPLEA